MKRMIIIWTIYIAGILAAFFLSSCATQHKYVASKEPVKTQAKTGKELTVFRVHLAGLIWLGIIIHFTNEDSK